MNIAARLASSPAPVSASTSQANGHGYDQARAAFFAGKGIGRAFITAFLPSSWRSCCATAAGRAVGREAVAAEEGGLR
jgi:hypothetical protein